MNRVIGIPRYSSYEHHTQLMWDLFRCSLHWPRFYGFTEMYYCLVPEEDLAMLKLTYGGYDYEVTIADCDWMLDDHFWDRLVRATISVEEHGFQL